MIRLEKKQENGILNAQENEWRYSDIFVLISVALYQKQPKAAFSKIKTTCRAALFLSTFSARSREENTSYNAQENESRYSDIFVLILAALFQKRPKAAFSKIKTTCQVALVFFNFGEH